MTCGHCVPFLLGLFFVDFLFTYVQFVLNLLGEGIQRFRRRLIFALPLDLELLRPKIFVILRVQGVHTVEHILYICDALCHQRCLQVFVGVGGTALFDVFDHVGALCAGTIDAHFSRSVWDRMEAARV